jgi:membrane fusion protein (multidrug efflux system)
VIAAATALALAACGKGGQQQMQMPPPEVGVIAAKAQSVPLTQDLVGRASATRSADVRARVAGVLQKRAYTEGSDVKEGQLLFEIDPAPLRAAYNAQVANLAAAQATYANAHAAADRARSVASKGLLSKTDLDNAQAAERTSAASVQQAKSGVEAAKINLDYTRVTAPISGRSSQQRVTEGALVGQGTATLLTTVEQVDPIYVNFSQAVGDMDKLRSAAASGAVHLAEQGKAKVEVLRADGTPSGGAGTLDFSDTAVDAATGAVSLRAILPNSDRALLPGQYVSVRVTLGELTHAWLINQQAVQRDASGAFVMVVGSDGNVAQKRIVADNTRGDSWVVTEGLADGDQVIASGLMKVRPGAPAKATPWQPGAPPPGAAQGAPGQAKPQQPQAKPEEKH